MGLQFAKVGRSVMNHEVDTVSRRISLARLGVALATAAVVVAGKVEAKKKKKSGNACQKKERQRCSKDAAACRNTVQLGCAPSDPTNCAEEQACCDACTANGFLTCLLLLNEE
jgi:hypothetical protein